MMCRHLTYTATVGATPLGNATLTDNDVLVSHVFNGAKWGCPKWVGFKALEPPQKTVKSLLRDIGAPTPP